MVITGYQIHAPSAPELRAAIVADLHEEDPEKLLSALNREKPDIILAPGDIIQGSLGTDTYRRMNFFRRAAETAPVYYSLGNHENLTETDIAAVKDAGITLLDNEYVTLRDKNGTPYAVGGLTSGFYRRAQGHFMETPQPDCGFLDRFDALRCYKILLCHHPEYWARYIRRRNISLTVSGHAHGGQWRLFGRGIFAPGQGFFPKYTAGMHENRFVISRGLANNAPFPRIFNRRELVMITLDGKNGRKK